MTEETEPAAGHYHTEYLDLGDKDYERISAMVRQTFPKSCICWIERVHNPKLWAAYQALGETIGNEQLMFHGTSEECVKQIVEHGFDPAKNKTSAYGRGTYFAKAASYSFNYMKDGTEGVAFMFLCRVRVGRVCKGSAGLRIDTKAYDSAGGPGIIVTPHAAAAFPEYIISFHKHAK